MHTEAASRFPSTIVAFVRFRDTLTDPSSPDGARTGTDTCWLGQHDLEDRLRAPGRTIPSSPALRRNVILPTG